MGSGTKENMLKRSPLVLLSIATAIGLSLTPTVAHAVDKDAVEKIESSVVFDAASFSAALIIVGMEEIDTIKLSDPTQNLGSVLEARDYKIDTYLDENASPLVKSARFSNKKTVIIYESGMQGTTSSISIPFEETVKDDPKLFKGQRVIESPGVVGTAIQTVIKTRSLAADDNVNTKTAADAGPGITEEAQLSIASAPVTQIVRVGTRECNSTYACKLAESDMFTSLVGGMAFPLGKSWPWTTYSGEASHDAGAMDLPAAQGSPIYSVSDGVVASSGWESGGGGNVAVITHSDGNSTAYAHMVEAPIVKTGDKVKAGELIGFVGSTGNSTGPHLHFEVRKGSPKWGEWIPAYSYLEANGLIPGSCGDGPCSNSTK